MADIVHRIGIKAPVAKVYAALATVEGVAGWWTRETTGESRVGGTVTFVFRTPAGDQKGKMVVDVTELETNRAVRWHVTAGPAEWLETDITFDLSQQGEHTIVAFGHRSWRESGEMMAHCSMKWATFLLSLRDLVQGGKGHPAPDDLKIDDWN